jgi:hypothetical protein
MVSAAPFNCCSTSINPLTPNDLKRRRAVSPLNSQMTYKDVAISVSKFGGILFTPIRITAVASYASGPLKVRLAFRSQNVPPPRTPIYTQTLSYCPVKPNIVERYNPHMGYVDSSDRMANSYSMSRRTFK